MRSGTVTALRLDLRWQSDAVQHCDSLFLPRVDIARSALPRPMMAALLDQPAGHRATCRFEPGVLPANQHPAELLTLQPNQFNKHYLGRGSVEPRRGRFYPGGILLDAPNRHGNQGAPVRVTEVSAGGLRLDPSHPLAGKALEVATTVVSVADAPPAGAGSALVADLLAVLTANGPGMQGRWRGRPTDFFADEPFLRLDDDDPELYARPRLVDHLDSTASDEIRALYGRLIPRRSRILDLMSSWHSHLPETLSPNAVAGLGMNAEELAQNPMLTERSRHDLNAEPRLPYADATFDAAVCTLSVEYLTDPLAVFRELARVLMPGGIAIMTFSNRWFPTKAIRLWEQLHELERPGLVLEYFRSSGCFQDFNTWSLRGLPRPAEDEYTRRLRHSDPVYAVWARRTGPVASRP
ncbi:MAG: methyltransferase domain-containing protein [Gammaproteobacteria bacterium]|jgi:SAM-dependent methyltransferase|nr:methyltransferase domain-containing protein [Gammaproteobacteria bacterium]